MRSRKWVRLRHVEPYGDGVWMVRGKGMKILTMEATIWAIVMRLWVLRGGEWGNITVSIISHFVFNLFHLDPGPRTLLKPLPLRSPPYCWTSNPFSTLILSDLSETSYTDDDSFLLNTWLSSLLCPCALWLFSYFPDPSFSIPLQSHSGRLTCLQAIDVTALFHLLMHLPRWKHSLPTIPTTTPSSWLLLDLDIPQLAKANFKKDIKVTHALLVMVKLVFQWVL